MLKKKELLTRLLARDCMARQGRKGENLWSALKSIRLYRFDEKTSYWSAPKAPNFSAFHW